MVEGAATSNHHFQVHRPENATSMLPFVVGLSTFSWSSAIKNKCMVWRCLVGHAEWMLRVPRLFPFLCFCLCRLYLFRLCRLYRYHLCRLCLCFHLQESECNIYMSHSNTASLGTTVSGTTKVVWHSFMFSSLIEYAF